MEDLTANQIVDFRFLVNGAISVLLPNHQPGDPFNFTKEQLRLIAGLLGTKGTAREVESYVVLEIEKWKNEPIRHQFLGDLLEAVLSEIKLLEFFCADKMQTEFRLPSHVKILNLDTGRSDREMPMSDFIESLKAISDSSVFKK